MRCYFNLEDGVSSILDEEGVEVADSRRALHQALSDVLEVLYSAPETSEWEGWKLRAVDSSGNLLFLINLDGPGRLLPYQSEAPSLPATLVHANPTPEHGQQERRGETRDRTFGRGRILLNDGRSIDCIIQDLSRRGARLSVPEGVRLPDSISIYLAKEDRAEKARVRWITADQVGIEFLENDLEEGNEEVARRGLG